MENTIYNLTDHHTGKILGTYTYAQRNRARNRAEKLNLQYGAHRYSAIPVFEKESDIETIGYWDGVGLVEKPSAPVTYKIDFSKMAAV